jgi:predicted site-specific integrase-resolvase
MTGRLTRAEVAGRIGVRPITIYRWEKRGISPVTPRRVLRTNELIYSEEDVAALEAWMHRTEPAKIGRES